MNLRDRFSLTSALKTFAFAGLLFPSASYAILGEYVSVSEHIPQACKLTLNQIRYKKTPVQVAIGEDHMYHVKKVLGKPFYTAPESDYFFCSATLVDKTAVSSAAHCYWPLFEKKEQRGIERVPTDPNEHPDPNVMRSDGNFFRVEIQQLGEKGAKVTCPGVNGVPEVQELEWQNGWLHPNFGFDGVAFDTAIFKIKGQFKTPPLRMARNYVEVVGLLRNWQTCRIFGYGVDNDGNSGELHGARAYQFNVVDYQAHFMSGFNNISSGDSGGTLMCKTPLGENVLVGINSKSNLSNPYVYPAYAHESYFSLTGFGSTQRWFDFVLSIPQAKKHGGESFSKDPNTKLHYFVAAWEILSETPGMIAELQGCVDFYQDHLPRSMGKKAFEGYEAVVEGAKYGLSLVAAEYNAWLKNEPTVSGFRIGVKPAHAPEARGRIDVNARRPDPEKLRKQIYRDYYRGKKTTYSPISDTFVFEFADPYTVPRSQYRPAWARMELDPVLKLLRGERYRCYNQAQSNDGFMHNEIPGARQLLRDELDAQVNSYSWEKKVTAPSGL